MQVTVTSDDDERNLTSASVCRQVAVYTVLVLNPLIVMSPLVVMNPLVDVRPM